MKSHYSTKGQGNDYWKWIEQSITFESSVDDDSLLSCKFSLGMQRGCFYCRLKSVVGSIPRYTEELLKLTLRYEDVSVSLSDDQLQSHSKPLY